MRIPFTDFLKISFRALQQELENETTGAPWLCEVLTDNLSEMTIPQIELLINTITGADAYDDDEENHWDELIGEAEGELLSRENEEVRAASAGEAA